MKEKKVKVNNGTVNVVAKPTKFAKMKASLKKNGKKIIAIGLTVLVVGGTVVAIKSCSKDNKNVVSEKQDEKYSRELLNERIKNFTEAAKTKGLELTEQEVRDLSIVMNIDRIVAEDPELAKELFEGKNAEDILSNAGHMIGKLMTYSFTNNYKKSMNLSTLVVGNDDDKAVMAKLEGYRDELTTMRAEEEGEHRVEFATEEEENKFDEIITDTLNFYSMSADGLEIDKENIVIQKMGDGDRFATVLVMNEIALGNKNILTRQQYKAFEELMSNEPVVENLTRIIEGCQTKEVETEKQKTK